MAGAVNDGAGAHTWTDDGSPWLQPLLSSRNSHLQVMAWAEGLSHGTRMQNGTRMSLAEAYAQGAAATILEASMGMVDKGAEISWLSQYEHEREITFPPLIGLEVLLCAVNHLAAVLKRFRCSFDPSWPSSTRMIGSHCE